MDDPGIPGFFVFFVVMMLVLAVVGVVVRISIARSMARKAGLDEDTATAAAMFTRDGLTATYLAGALREGQGQHEADSPAVARLKELRSLLDQGLVTQAEYDTRRQQILDEV